MINAECEVNIFVCELSFIFTGFAQIMQFSDWQQSSEIGANCKIAKLSKVKRERASTLVPPVSSGSQGSLCSIL